MDESCTNLASITKYLVNICKTTKPSNNGEFLRVEETEEKISASNAIAKLCLENNNSVS